MYESIILHLHKSLHNQGVCEQEKIALMKIEVEEVREDALSSPVKMQLLRKDSQSCLMEVCVCVVVNGCIIKNPYVST